MGIQRLENEVLSVQPDLIILEYLINDACSGNPKVIEHNVAFVGGFTYYDHLHQYGKYFITELKGNMVNHPYGNVDTTWGAFDRVLSKAILRLL